jgi:hypothetical protein
VSWRGGGLSMRGSIHATRRFPSGANSRGGKRAASLTAFNVLAGNGYSVLAVAVEDSRAAVTEYAKAAKLTFATALDLNSSVKRAAGDLLYRPPRDEDTGSRHRPAYAGTSFGSAEERWHSKMIIVRLLHYINNYVPVLFGATGSNSDRKNIEIFCSRFDERCK